MWGAGAQARYFAVMASNISRVSALRRSGRFKVTTPARSFSSKLTPGASDKMRCLPTRNRCNDAPYQRRQGAIRPAAASTQSLKPQVSRKRQSPPVMTLKPLAWLTLIVLVALPAAAVAEGADTPPLPQRNPFRAPAQAKPVLPKNQPTIPWTKAEIGAATAKCNELLTGDPLDYELLPPIKEGICGTPAPVLLRAVGKDPKVVIDPPATMSCPMADTLGEWLRNTVQPEAIKLFGSPVAKIQNASSYVCRNRYNGTNTLLSEHALANAFDVSQFVLANGTRITVREDWPRVATLPPPEPNPARVDDSAATNSVAKQKSGDRGNDIFTPAKAESSTPPSPAPVATEEDHASASSNPFVTPKAQVATEEDYGSGHPSNPFVEPKSGDRGEDASAPAKADADTPTSPPPVATEPAPDAKGQFVTFLFEDACRHFGTVLGPNANEAHKDHFHLDMKKRRKSNFCE